MADAGQVILVTIHQPSASLFYQFDKLLLLAKGGKTVYNGPIGKNAECIRNYFGREGAPCPEDGNPAEHMIDVVSGPASRTRDWHQTWLQSKENAQLMNDLEQLESKAQSEPVKYVEDGHEFAMPLGTQCLAVLQRNSVSLFRDTDYIMNKFILHITSALFNG